MRRQPFNHSVSEATPLNPSTQPNYGSAGSLNRNTFQQPNEMTPLVNTPHSDYGTFNHDGEDMFLSARQDMELDEFFAKGPNM